jgi:inhibitor of KinA sporulation pathway (predicted exonuclease)
MSKMSVHDLEKHSRAVYIDVELTCWSGPPPSGMKPEIIEIGIVEMDLAMLTITRERSHFIRPRRWEISSKCTKLTGITAGDIRLAQHFPQVLDAVIDEFAPSKALCCMWGHDAALIADTCKLHGLKSPLRNLLDLAHLVKGLFLLKQNPSLKHAIQLLGLEFHGVAHTAIVDAHNTARTHAAVIQRMREDLGHSRAPVNNIRRKVQLSNFAEKLKQSLSECPELLPDEVLESRAE